MNILSRKFAPPNSKATPTQVSALAGSNRFHIPDLHASKQAIWCLACLFVIIWLYALGLRTLVPPDEGRYAEMAREMWASGDWITTRLNGIKYFEKPPLQTWMNALTFTLFGLGDWQARLWTGLCGLIGIGATAVAGTRVFGGRVGLYGALILGSSLFWVAAGQINSLDMGLSGMMTLALCSLLIAQRDGATASQRRNAMLACWTAMALSVLAKGLIGVVLPGAVLVIYTLLTRDWQLWSRLHLGKGLLLFFAICTPWFVLVGLANPEQPHFFFIHEHWDRFMRDDHHRTGAWYYFVPGLVVGILPWLGLLPQSLIAAARTQHAQFRPRLMLLIWAGFIFLFFSYSSSKLPGYIVPIFPALALMIALHLACASSGQRRLASALQMTFGSLLLGVVPFVPGFASRPAEVVLMQAYQPYILGAGAVSLAGGLLAWNLARQFSARDLCVLSMAVAGFLSTQLLLLGFEPYGEQRAAVKLAPQIAAELKPESILFSVGTYEQSLPFYLERTVTLVAYTDEFGFGLEQEPERAIATVDEFVERWKARAAGGINDVALLREDTYLALQARGVPMRIVTRDTRRIIVASR